MRYIDFTDEDDYRCVLLGAMGFSSKFITKKTKLSPGQISYRLKKAQIKRSDYRDGTGQFARTVIKTATNDSERILARHLVRK